MRGRDQGGDGAQGGRRVGGEADRRSGSLTDGCDVIGPEGDAIGHRDGVPSLGADVVAGAHAEGANDQIALGNNQPKAGTGDPGHSNDVATSHTGRPPASGVGSYATLHTAS